MANGSSLLEGAAAIADSLARVLGDEAAEGAVREGVRQLGLADRPLGRREQVLLFEWLAQRPGLVGAAARRAAASLTLGVSANEAPRVVVEARGAAREQNHAAPPRVVKPALGADAIQGSELVGMFASALGDEKAREMIEAECRRMSLDFERVSPASARLLLDELAKTAGIVGIAARFAKARIALR